MNNRGIEGLLRLREDTGTITNGYKLAMNKFMRKLLESIQTEKQGFYPSCISHGMLLQKSQLLTSVPGTMYTKEPQMLETPSNTAK